MKNKYDIEIEDINSYLIEHTKKYSALINQYNNVRFYYKGKILQNDNRLKIRDLSNSTIIISVFALKTEKKNDISKNIMCKQCNNLSLFSFNDDKKITLENCKQYHKNTNIKLKDFIENQKKEQNSVCFFCGNDKNYYNDAFYFTLDEKKICPICAKIYNKNGIMIEYRNRYYNCNKHYIEYISYCSICNKNLCEKCEENHNKTHETKIINYKKIKRNKKIKETKNEIEENLTKINLCKMKLRALNEFLNEVILNAENDIENYATLYEILLYSLKNVKNYETINNINNFRAKKINKEIDLFLNENLFNRIKILINKYNNEVETITYNKINPNDTKIKIFGKEFVKNNKNICYLDINNEFYDIQEYVNVKEKKKIKINLIGKNKMSNLSYMFHKCASLLSLGIYH